MPTVPMPRLLRQIALLASGAWPAAGVTGEVALQAEQSRYDAVETLPGGFVLNRDSGVLRGAGLLASDDAAGARWGLALRALDGALRYDGLTQFGVPLQTRTDLRWQRAALSVAPVDALRWSGLLATPALSLGTLRVVRGIAATPGSLPTTEMLQSRFVGLDAGVHHDFGALTLGLTLGAQYPLRQRLAVDTSGVYDNYSLRPQARWWTQAALRAEWSGAGRWSVAATLGRDRLRFGSADAQLVTSHGVPAAISSYPGSTQRLDSTQLSATLRF